VALERGLDLSSHRARLLTPELVRRADLILTMSEAHAHRVADMGGAMKVHTWTGYAAVAGAAREVPDPFGGDVQVYRETADLLEGVVDEIVRRLLDSPGQ
jgi:protein-tyrosine phosphatase